MSDVITQTSYGDNSPNVYPNYPEIRVSNSGKWWTEEQERMQAKKQKVDALAQRLGVPASTNYAIGLNGTEVVYDLLDLLIAALDRLEAQP